MRRWALLVTLTIAALTALLAADARATSWNLVFEDNFDVLDSTSTWSVYNSAGHAGNGLRRPEAFSIVDDPDQAGNKLLRVRAEQIAGSVVSGGMAHRRNYTYGAFEARIRCEADPSSTMSCVWLTWPQSENFPVDGENDIYETLLDPDRRPVRSFVHYGAANNQYSWSHDVDGQLWHVFRMEWTASTIKFFVDGVQSGATLTDAAAIPDVAHHMSIQLDAFDNSLPAPTHQYVDWVRVYQAAVEPPAQGGGGGAGGAAGPPKCAGRRATIVGTAGRDVLRGTRRADVIVALGGNDVVLGAGGNDLVCGGPGNDRLLGGLGADRLLGGPGKDQLFGGPGKDQLFGGLGADRLFGGAGRDLLRGGPGRDSQKQ